MGEGGVVEYRKAGETLYVPISFSYKLGLHAECRREARQGIDWTQESEVFTSEMLFF